HQARPRARRRPGERDAAQAEPGDDGAHQVPGAGDRRHRSAADAQPVVVRLNKIYTRTGDDGTSGLVDGSRRAKHDPRFEAIGAVDEANAVIGWAALAVGEAHAGDIAMIQNDLFDLGADLATPGEVEGALRIA